MHIFDTWLHNVIRPYCNYTFWFRCRGDVLHRGGGIIYTLVLPSVDFPVFDFSVFDFPIQMTGRFTGRSMNYLYSRSPLCFYYLFYRFGMLFSCRGDYTGEEKYLYSRSPLYKPKFLFLIIYCVAFFCHFDFLHFDMSILSFMHFNHFSTFTKWGPMV